MKPIILKINDYPFIRLIRIENILEIDAQFEKDQIWVVLREVTEWDTTDRSLSSVRYVEYFSVDNSQDPKYIQDITNLKTIGSYISVDVAEAIANIISDEVAKCLSTEHNILDTCELRLRIRREIPVIREKILSAYSEGKIKYDLD